MSMLLDDGVASLSSHDIEGAAVRLADILGDMSQSDSEPMGIVGGFVMVMVLSGGSLQE